MALFIRTLIATVILPGSAAVLGPYWVVSVTDAHLPDLAWSARWLGALPIALGIGIYLWCALDFAVAGRGTPAPWDAPRRLVVRGLYRHVRNPMYVGVTAVLVGEVIVFASGALALYAVAVWLAFNARIAIYEEPTLHARFGDSYDDYRRTVPRWLPRWRAGDPR